MPTMLHLPAFTFSVKKSRRNHPSILSHWDFSYTLNIKDQRNPLWSSWLTHPFGCVAVTTLLPIPTFFSVEIRDNLVLCLPVCETPGECWMTQAALAAGIPTVGVPGDSQNYTASGKCVFFIFIICKAWFLRTKSTVWLPCSRQSKLCSHEEIILHKDGAEIQKQWRFLLLLSTDNTPGLVLDS